LTSTEPADRRKAAPGLSVHKFPFREVSPRSICSGCFRKSRRAKRNSPRSKMASLLTKTSGRNWWTYPLPPAPRRGRSVSSWCRLHRRAPWCRPQCGLPRALAWIIERANLSQSSTYNKAQIHNMIHTVNRLHVEDRRDIVAIGYVLLYLYTLDERKDAGEEAHDCLPACQLRHQWPLKRYIGCEGHRRKVFARETVQITHPNSGITRSVRRNRNRRSNHYCVAAHMNRSNGIAPSPQGLAAVPSGWRDGIQAGGDSSVYPHRAAAG
jgi:hypothetical protein